jgi:hypothetical protein
MPSIGIQTTAPRKVGTFATGKKAGIYITLNYILPMDLDIMNKDLVRAGAQYIGIPGYSKMTLDELKQSIRNRGINKIGFKPNRQRTNVEIITKS